MKDIERIDAPFSPKFNADGLIPCITMSARDHAVLMFAWMNKESLRLSLATGEVHYWSRSRSEIWHKGATSGMTQKIIDMRIDCDQDCILVYVEMPLEKDGHEVSCHTGQKSCFYRSVKLNQESGETYMCAAEDV